MSINNTEHAKYHFTIKEGSPSEKGADAPVFLMCEPMDRELSIVGNNGYLAIRLKKHLKIEDAKQLVSVLSEMVDSISYTKIK